MNDETWNHIPGSICPPYANCDQVRCQASRLTIPTVKPELEEEFDPDDSWDDDLDDGDLEDDDLEDEDEDDFDDEEWDVELELNIISDNKIT